MSIFNWGNETPEQRAIRARLEQEALFEQAVRMSQARNRGNNTMFGGAGGSGGQSPAIPLSTARQTELLMVKQEGSNTWQYYIQDYDINYFIGPLDSTVSAADYNLDRLYAINQKGYACIFRGIENPNDYVLWFIDTKTRTFTTYYGTTSDLQYNYMGYSWLLLTDFDEQKMWYFDGETVVYDTSFFQGAVSYSAGSDSYEISSDGFGLRVTTNTEERFCVVNSTGIHVLFERDLALESEITYEFHLNAFSNKAVLIKLNNSISRYEEISVYDIRTETLVESLELNSISSPSLNFTDRTFQFFGENQWFATFYNSPDLDVEWLVIFYNGDTNTLSFELVDRNEYPNNAYYYVELRPSSYNDYTKSNCAAIVLRSSQGYADGLEEISACKILYVINGGSINTYDFKLPGIGSNSFLSGINVGSSFLSLHTTNGDDLRITKLLNESVIEHTIYEPLLSGINNSSNYMIGDRHFYSVELVSGGLQVTVIESDASQEYSLFVDSDPNNISINFDYDVLVIKTLDKEYYLNQATNDFTQIDLIEGFYGSQAHYDPIYYTQSKGVVLEAPNNGIPYTHTQLNMGGEVAIENFIMDGSIISGTANNFGVGSQYFTNLYPGLFVLHAQGIDINTFRISGNIGADGNGNADNYSFLTTVGGSQYKVFVKRVFDAGDPSINQIIILNGNAVGSTQQIDSTTDFDTHIISNIPGTVDTLHYLLMAQDHGTKISNSDIESIVAEYLSIVHGKVIATALSDLNTNYENVTGVLHPITDPSPRIYFFSDDGNTNSSISDGGNDMYDDANIINTDRSIQNGRILTRFTNRPVQFNYIDFDTEVGPNFIVIAHWKNNTIWIDMIRLDGTLVYSIDTGKTAYDNFAVVGDRASIHTYDKYFDGVTFYNRYTSYMLTLSGVKTQSFIVNIFSGVFSYNFNDAPYID